MPEAKHYNMLLMLGSCWNRASQSLDYTSLETFFTLNNNIYHFNSIVTIDLRTQTVGNKACRGTQC